MILSYSEKYCSQCACSRECISLVPQNIQETTGKTSSGGLSLVNFLLGRALHREGRINIPCINFSLTPRESILFHEQVNINFLDGVVAGMLVF